MKRIINQLQPNLRRVRGRRAAAILIAAATLLLVAGALLIVRSHVNGAGTPVPSPAGASQPAARPGQTPATPGLLNLDDFQIVIPAGWERRPDLEDTGPGTKLILFGPKVNDTPLFIGIDVYPLRSGTTLDQFVEQYASRSLAGKSFSAKKATLCDQPARMLGLGEGGLDKVYLVTVWRDKGFVIGMIGPSGHTASNTQAFRTVVDTFQLYE